MDNVDEIQKSHAKDCVKKVLRPLNDKKSYDAQNCANEISSIISDYTTEITQPLFDQGIASKEFEYFISKLREAVKNIDAKRLKDVFACLKSKELVAKTEAEASPEVAANIAMEIIANRVFGRRVYEKEQKGSKDARALYERNVVALDDAKAKDVAQYLEEMIFAVHSCYAVTRANDCNVIKGKIYKDVEKLDDALDKIVFFLNQENEHSAKIRVDFVDSKTAQILLDLAIRYIEGCGTDREQKLFFTKQRGGKERYKLGLEVLGLLEKCQHLDADLKDKIAEKKEVFAKIKAATKSSVDEAAKVFEDLSVNQNSAIASFEAALKKNPRETLAQLEKMAKSYSMSDALIALGSHLLQEKGDADQAKNEERKKYGAHLIEIAFCLGGSAISMLKESYDDREKQPPLSSYFDHEKIVRTCEFFLDGENPTNKNPEFRAAVEDIKGKALGAIKDGKKKSKSGDARSATAGAVVAATSAGAGAESKDGDAAIFADGGNAQPGTTPANRTAHGERRSLEWRSFLPKAFQRNSGYSLIGDEKGKQLGSK